MTTTADNLSTFRAISLRVNQVNPSKVEPPPREAVLARAGRVIEGYVMFNGTEELYVGQTGIDWLAGHRNHQEWPAQLNRFFMLAHLEAAWELTGEERYAARARELIEDWLDFMVRVGAPFLHERDNPLNMSIRIGQSRHSGWLRTIDVFADSKAFDEAFVERMFASIGKQVDDLLANGLTPVGNWRISQLDCILYVGLCCPFLPNSEQYLAHAVPRLKACFKHQFLADGSHIELTPNYHFWMAQVLHHFYLMSAEFDELAMDIDRELVERAIRLVAYYERFPINDSNPSYNQADVPGGDLRVINAQLAQIGAAPMSWPLPELFCPETGYLFAGDGTNELLFDVSNYGGSHTHSSRLQVGLNSGNRALVIDPGTISYEMSDPLAPYGKSTAAHSTLNIDDFNQGPSGALLTLQRSTERYSFGEGRFEGGYWSGENLWGFSKGLGEGRWAGHSRAVLLVKNEYVVVLDVMAATAGQTIHNNWQLAAFGEWEVDLESKSFVSQDPGKTNLLLSMVFEPEGGVEMSVACGQEEPCLRGWAGIPGARAIPAPLVDFSYPGGVTHGGMSAVILVPFTSDEPPVYRVLDTALNTGFSMYFQLETPSGEIDTIAWAPGGERPLDEGLPIVSSSSFVYQRADAAGRVLSTFTGSEE